MKVIIPEFAHEAHFRTFVGNMSDEDIRNMDCEDWATMFRNLDKMYGKDEKPSLLKAVALDAILRTAGHFYELTSRFVPKLKREVEQRIENVNNSSDVNLNKETFFKLYRNYRMKPDEKQDIIDFAFQSADNFMIKNDNAERYALEDISPQARLEKKRVAKQVRDAVYDAAYGDDMLTRAYVPRVTIQPAKRKTTNGEYTPALHKIKISPAKTAGISTMAHETMHSTQGVSLRHNILKMLNHRYSSNNRMSEIYVGNTKYYFNSVPTKKNNESDAEYRKRKHDYHRAYRRQPSEYAARLFGAMFKYRVHQQALFKKHISGVLDACGFAHESSFSAGDKELQLKFVFDDVKGIRLTGLQELNEKYLLADLQKRDDGKICLSFDCEKNNQKRLFEEYKYFNSLIEKHGGRKDKLLREALPDVFASMQNVGKNGNAAGR